ncbi:MAG: AIR synthase-related protein, partial [Candidatus Thermoplasmatota archaeon]|nr:AIR synthase-related protein [Candidatus Thermoplasmatota archaeon]
GIPSSGVHSNGYSLVRKVLEVSGVGYDDKFPGGVVETPEGKTWGEVLLTPTKIYVKPVLEALEKHHVHGMAHITGGGLWNIPRMNKNVGYEITNPLPVLPVFKELQRLGGIEDKEMYQTFNMGMGFAMAAPADEAGGIMALLSEHGEKAQVVGRITEGKGIRHVPLGLEYVE